jgi:hypothetical protein
MKADKNSLNESQELVPLLKIDIPLLLILPRKTKADKRYILNLNVYRNTHHRTLNDVKQQYKDIVIERCIQTGACKETFEGKQLRFVYTLYPGSRRRVDIANPLCIIQKFTDDAIVAHGLIEDDCNSIIPAVDYRYGSVCKENPRATLEIFEWSC